ncbi:beta-N-acetylhexosaminidase [Streptacidiphilus cavernicola]|uniref:beta-N-acetylhexosaminidase n=1 Tax=Streptacidiphilus cavernicola TaxID=3342716 RepID=A0ABV6VSD2_9ACTN
MAAAPFRRLLAALFALGLLTASPVASASATAAPRPPVASFADILPAPVSAVPAAGVSYTLRRTDTLSSDVPGIGGYLAAVLRRSTGYPFRVGTAPGAIALLLSGAPASVGPQGYRLDVTAHGVTVRARAAAGLFAGVQTLLQLLPPSVQGSRVVKTARWTLPGGRVIDHPRYAYRGAMLDVARHFFTVAQVERYTDQLAHYKIDYLHLHLTDDQGWRIAISGLPRLTSHGGSTEVGGGRGGYYTEADYRAIVRYAQARYITVVPEIDMPGHTNAALSSYPRLTCDGVVPRLYTGMNVGFSSLCVRSKATYAFLETVIARLAALTPGPYLHIGGDEAQSTSRADYAAFVNRVQAIVAARHKTVIGWHDIVAATLRPSTVAQFWSSTTGRPGDRAVAAAARRGTKVIMSPASRAYLDMRYTSATRIGADWAGRIDVSKAYDWNPGAYLPGLPASAVLGVEAPLWTETVRSSADLDYLAFPRVAAIAELGWSPASSHSWPRFRVRLAAQGPRWRAEGVRYYRSTQIDWPAGS